MKLHETPLEQRRREMCNQCGARFATHSQLRTHIKAVHLKLKPYRCKICNIKFAHVCNLQEHIGLRHLGFKDTKEWRLPENKETRTSALKHEAFEFTPLTKEQEKALSVAL